MKYYTYISSQYFGVSNSHNSRAIVTQTPCTTAPKGVGVSGSPFSKLLWISATWAAKLSNVITCSCCVCLVLLPLSNVRFLSISPVRCLVVCEWCRNVGHNVHLETLSSHTLSYTNCTPWLQNSPRCVSTSDICPLYLTFDWKCYHKDNFPKCKYPNSGQRYWHTVQRNHTQFSAPLRPEKKLISLVRITNGIFSLPFSIDQIQSSRAPKNKEVICQ